MKRFKFILLLIIFTPIDMVFASDPAYKAALDLESAVLSQDLAKVKKILIDQAGPGVLDDLYRGNTYFEKFFDPTGNVVMPADNPKETQAELQDAMREVTALNSGFLSAASFAEGTSAFLIERAKSELQANVLSRLQKALNENPYLKSLFPKTSKFLEEFEIMHFEMLLDNLITTVKEDLAALPSNVEENLLNKRPFSEESWRSEHTNLLTSIAVLQCIYGIKQGESVVNTLKNLNSADYLTGTDNIQKTLKLIGHLTHEVLPDEGIENVSTNYLAGFLYQKSKEVLLPGSSGTSLSEAIKTDEASLLTSFASLIKGLHDRGKIMAVLAENENFFSNINFQNQVKLLFQDIEEFVGEEIPALLGDPQTVIKLNYVSESIDMIRYIQQKNYGMAVAMVANLLMKERPNEGDARVADEAADENNKLIKKSSKKFFDYAILLANFASAQSADQVTEALNALALPIGSSRIKKDSYFNVALNSYVGYFDLLEAPSSSTSALGYTVSQGITAPIGIGISTGFKEGGSLTVFGNAFDLGAVVSYQLMEDSSAVSPDINWANIISPGLHLVYGAPFYLPLSLHIGYQWTPIGEAEKLTLEGYWRAGITIDIPVINLYSSKRRAWKD